MVNSKIVAKIDKYYNECHKRAKIIELIQEQSVNEHWQDVRERAAIAAMQETTTILGSGDRSVFSDIIVAGYPSGKERTYPKEIANFAVACANALVEKLKRKYK